MYTYHKHPIIDNKYTIIKDNQPIGIDIIIHPGQTINTIINALNNQPRSANKELQDQHTKDTNEIASLWLLILRIGNVIKDYHATNESAPRTALEMIENYLKNADQFAGTEEIEEAGPPQPNKIACLYCKGLAIQDQLYPHLYLCPCGGCYDRTTLEWTKGY